MLLNTLITILFIEVIVSLILFKGDIISPAFIFSVGFLLAAIILHYNIDYWKVNISRTTVNLVCGGVGAFIIGSFIVSTSALGINILKNKKSVQTTEIKPIILNKNFMMLMIIFYVVVEGLMLLSIRNIALQNGGGGSIFSLIGYYNNLAKGARASEVQLSVLLNQGIIVCIYLGFIWAYILINNFLYEKKIGKYVTILFLLSCLCGMISGSRGDSLMLTFCAVVMYIILVRKKNNKKLIKVPFKSIVIGTVIAILIIVTFQKIAVMLGRDAALYQANEYLSIYTGGPLLNLNNCIIRGMDKPLYWGQETFMYMVKLVGSITNNKGMQEYLTSRVYYQANYHNTGNVCTIFYELFYDFGLKGSLILSFIMGLVSQMLYVRVKNNVKLGNGLNFSIIMFSYILFLVFRSFFANSFLNVIASLSFVKIIIIWLVATKLFEKIKITV